MNVYKNYSDIIKRKVLFVLFYGAVLMLLLSVLVNLTKAGNFTRIGQNQVRVGVINHDTGEVSKNLMKYLEKFCDLVPMEEQWKEKLDDLYYRNVYYILTIPENHSEHILDGTVKLESDSISKSVELNYVNELIYSYVDNIRTLQKLHPDKSIKEMSWKASCEDVDNIQAVQMKTNDVEMETVKNNTYYNLLGFILFACITSVVCSSMYAYRKKRIYRRHLISPVSETSMNLQLLLGSLAYSYLYAVVFLALVATTAKQVALNVNTILYWINAFAYTTSIVLFAFCLSFRIRNKVIMYLTANIGGIILSFTGGVFIRQDYLSPQVVKLTTITPVYWFVRGNDLIMGMSSWNSDKLVPLIQIFGIQMLFAAVFYCFVLAGMKLDAARK